MIRILSFFLIIVLLSSCGEQKEEYEYYRLGKQITPSGNYIIYDYARYGPMAFSSDISGLKVFRINEEFKEEEGELIDGSISEWISDDTLLVFNFESDLKQPRDTLPIKTEFEKVGDFVIKLVYYKSNSGGRAIYDFDSVTTSSDSIFIRTVSDKQKREILRFPLGGTTIKTKSDSITHIEISTRLIKSMNFVYKNPDGTFTSGLPEVGTTRYELTPIKRISPKELNTKRIFWDE